MEAMEKIEEREDRVVRCRAIVLHDLESLANGDTRPETLHRLRTHLRRLQAYLELVGEEANAEIVAECVSRFSSLRTLQVLDAYLAKSVAPDSDLHAVRVQIEARRARLERKRVYSQVERLVRRHAIPPIPGGHGWLGQRMTSLREMNGVTLRDLALKAVEAPRRKTLHLLRLKIKSVRYQEEWALHEACARPDTVAWLKRAQRVLGEYEERGQFRKLARRLDLACTKLIERDWRKARKRARALPAQIIEKLKAPAPSGLRLVKTNRHESGLAV
jgi:CHAD domain-containing protein